METMRRPSRPALLSLFAAALSIPAAALPAHFMPLPGYAPATNDLRLSARAEAAFPSTESEIGESHDPLASLGVDEDLHDSLNSLPPAEALKIALRDASVANRLDAVRSAAFPKDVAAVPPLAGLMLRLDQPARLRAAAALALGLIGDRVAVPSLAEALKDPSPNVRFSAALSLGRLPADGVATRLEKVLRSDPSWGPRYAAAIALGRTRKTFVAGALAEALTSDPAWQVRQQAARSLQELGTASAADALLDALSDPEPTVRAAAGSALSEIGGPEQRRAVAQALHAETDPSVRAILAAAQRRALTRS